MVSNLSRVNKVKGHATIYGTEYRWCTLGANPPWIRPKKKKISYKMDIMSLKEMTTTAYAPPSLTKNFHKSNYHRSIAKAPLTALVGVKVDGRQPKRCPDSPRHRVRYNVGSTNRWRIPQSLGSDLLGSSQALKSINIPYNRSMVNILTSDNPRNEVNRDVSKEYRFRLTEDRPSSDPSPRRAPGYLPETKRWKEMLYLHDYSQSEHSGGRSPSSLNSFQPTSSRPTQPQQLFQYHSRDSKTASGPDVLLHCLDMNWELHRPYLQKSRVLSALLHKAGEPKTYNYFRDSTGEALDSLVNKSKMYSTKSQGLDANSRKIEVKGDHKGLANSRHISQKRMANAIFLSLDIDDPLVTKHALAIALGNLYHDQAEVETVDVAGVLAAAAALGFEQLETSCRQIMINTISSSTVATYHKVAEQYGQEEVVCMCERWLDLNLVPWLSTQIHLRQLPFDLLQKTLRSNRLFCYNENSLYKVVAYWLFLQLNPNMQLLPSYSTVLTYFNSLPKTSALLERHEGQMYIPLFQALRLDGINDTNHMKDIQQMNIIPQSWLVKILTEHYHALQGGGDMSLLQNFNMSAVRHGFIVDKGPQYNSQILSLHGFHFELKAVYHDGSKATYSFFMQRLRPTDPALSFRQCERHTFSMRPDRDVRYCILVQTMHQGEHASHSTGVQCQRFALGSKTSKSKVLTIENLVPPIHVSFAIQFPPS
ncbi:unnamed protein product [Owenia fusiformis]|uniref:Uncharacterized protein n=1 Tax=Owenia fusiformis TaxID=6347 RepID=A0A8J1T5C2_OWEFU|nr:unnamed protein product [Owenia fusiformis]